MKKTEKKITAKQKAMWFKAVRNRDVKTIQKMLEEGFDVNVKDKFGWTALMDVSSTGCCDIAKILLDKKAGVNIRDGSKQTALFKAVHTNKVDIAKLLVNNGIDVNIKDIHGDTPLHIACYRSYTEMIKFLIENGADVTAENEIENKKMPFDNLLEEMKKYQELIQWLTEHYPDKALELMAHQQKMTLQQNF